jgi:hypothetical protein
VTRRSLVLIALVACAKRPPDPGPAPLRVEPPVASRSSAPPPAASSAPPLAPRSACHPPAPGTTSSDVTPAVRGATGEVELLPWLDARGVGRAAALGWFAARYGPGLTKEHAEAAFGGAYCGTLRVGDPPEDALVCELGVPTLIMQVHALILTVRAKRPVAVLDVGLGMIAMDFPDARWLDLSLAIAPDGRSAELADRAPDGTVLVEPESACREQERRDAECEAKLAAHPDPESLARKMGAGEVFSPLDGCMVHRKKDGRIAVVRRGDMSPMIRTYPATLHDCSGGREGLVSMQREVAQSAPAQRKEAREALAFFDRSCAARGRWVWQRDRFVKER